MTALLTADEAARLRPGERLVIVRPGDRYDPRQMAGGGGPLVHQFVAPQDWVALTGPCPTCKGTKQSDTWRCGDCNYEPYVTSITDVDAGPPKRTCPHCKGDYTWTRDPCPDCRDGRRIVPLYTEIDEFGCDGSGTCPSRAHILGCFNGPGEYSHYVNGGVLAGRGSVEVIPVVAESDMFGARPLDAPYLLVMDSGPVVFIETDRLVDWGTEKILTFDPSPVPGRDFGIVIDCVEIAS